MRAATRRVAAATAAVLLAAGCAPREGAETTPGAGEHPIRVTVQNDGTIPTQVRVSLVPAAGAPVNLGTLGTLGTGTLTGTLPFRGTYRIRAEGGTGYLLTSPPVTLRGNETVVWDMRRNRVTLARR
jgi:hypothetical protein